MHSLASSDVEFERRFAAGEIPPAQFDHRGHLHLAYVHLARRGPDGAAAAFRESLLSFLRRNDIDPARYHETLTQAWLQAVWHFMQRAGNTSSGEEFLQTSTVLQDPKVMLTHYSREVLFSEAARARFVPPDLEAIPQGAHSR